MGRLADGTARDRADAARRHRRRSGAGVDRSRKDFGALREPIIKLAVAVILFEGGLSLKFRELRHAGVAVFMLVFVGVPVGWALGTAAAYYGAGLPFELAALFGGIMVVTGPTVIVPLLRTLNITPRVKHMLKWEAIVNDPIGALLAVGIYSYIIHGGSAANGVGIVTDVVAASLLAMLIGGAAAFALTAAFVRGWVPEYLKAPVLLTTVIAVFVLSDLIMHETGLITVTVMGVVMANRETDSSHMLMRFKEDLTVLLVSGCSSSCPPRSTGPSSRISSSASCSSSSCCSSWCGR